MKINSKGFRVREGCEVDLKNGRRQLSEENCRGFRKGLSVGPVD